MLDAKHAHSDKLNMELDKEILDICDRYPEAMDADKQQEDDENACQAISPVSGSH